MSRYRVTVEWTGNRGEGTATYAGYARDHLVSAPGKPDLAGSSDPQFRGDAARWNPEELLLAALSACHQLWYLHLCATAGVVVTAYRDEAVAEMTIAPNGAGQFTRALLRPAVTIAAGSDPARAAALHGQASRMCFVARSVSFPVTHEPAAVQMQG